VKTRCILAESSEGGYGSKRAVLPMMMIMMMNLDGLHHPTVSVDANKKGKIILQMNISRGFNEIHVSSVKHT
jgi:hypothetical protein